MPLGTSVRALGVDLGKLRVGLALSDETGTIASPLTTIRRRRGKRAPLSQIEETALRHDVKVVVVGLPLDLSGCESDWSREVREIARKLGAHLELPVHLIDERMSSVQAKQAVRGIGLPRRKREERERVDSAAAAIILQRWLDQRRVAR